MRIRSSLRYFITLSLLFITQTVSADFNRASNALQNRDGAIMLAEIKHAVNKKSDAGMYMFIMQLRKEYMAKAFLSETEKTKEKVEHANYYSFTNLLDEEQSRELIRLLNLATQQSNRNNQYFESRAAIIYLTYEGGANSLTRDSKYLATKLAWRKAWNELANEAKCKLSDRQVIALIAENMFHSCEPNNTELFKCLTLAAELGDPYAQSDLAHLYFGETNIDYYNFIRSFYKKNIPRLVERNVQNANYWSEQSVINSEFPYSTSAYCQVAKRLQYGDATQEIDLKQAYLYYLWDYLSISYRAEDSCAKDGLIVMFKAGDLAKIAPEYNNMWQIANKNWPNNNAPPPIEGVKQFELPKLMKFANKSHDEELVFTYSPDNFYFNRINIYKNGLVVLKKRWTINVWNVDLSTISNLIKDVRANGFDNWPVYQDLGVFGSPNQYRFAITIRDKSFIKMAHGDRPDVSKKIYHLIQRNLQSEYITCEEVHTPIQ